MAAGDDIVKKVGDVYGKLPPLPKSVTEFLVTVAPWVSLILGVLGVLGSLAAFGLSTVASPLIAMGGGMHTAGGLIIASIISLLASVLLLVAVPGLMKRKMQGWTFLFYSEALGIIGAVVSLSVTSVIFSLIWLYFVFQMKSYYK